MKKKKSSENEVSSKKSEDDDSDFDSVGSVIDRLLEMDKRSWRRWKKKYG